MGRVAGTSRVHPSAASPLPGTQPFPSLKSASVVSQEPALGEVGGDGLRVRSRSAPQRLASPLATWACALRKCTRLHFHAQRSSVMQAPKSRAVPRLPELGPRSPRPTPQRTAPARAPPPTHAPAHLTGPSSSPGPREGWVGGGSCGRWNPVPGPPALPHSETEDSANPQIPPDPHKKYGD